MSEEKKLIVSSSPHMKSPTSVPGIMLDVVISLIPAAFAGIAVFGFRAAAVIATCIISCVLFEFFARKIMKRSVTIGDLSAVVTGLLPTTGVSLPFFSYGGTALVLQLIEVGIVLSVSRQCKKGAENETNTADSHH